MFCILFWALYSIYTVYLYNTDDMNQFGFVCIVHDSVSCGSPNSFCEIISLDCWQEYIWPGVSWANRYFCCESAGLSPSAAPRGTVCISMDTSYGGRWHTPIAAELASATISVHPPPRAPPPPSAISNHFTFCVAIVTGSLGSGKSLLTHPTNAQSYSNIYLWLNQKAWLHVCSADHICECIWLRKTVCKACFQSVCVCVCIHSLYFLNASFWWKSLVKLV